MSTRPYLFIFIVYYLWERRKRTQGEFLREEENSQRGEEKRKERTERGRERGKKREREGGIES